MELEYCNDAILNKAVLNGKKYVVFVEGDDDISFWRFLFSCIGHEAFYFEHVGGKENLKHYIKKIKGEDLSIIVASDADYSRFFENTTDHPRVIHTYGYSIENSMYRVNAIAEVIAKFSKSADERREKVEDWKTKFLRDLNEILVYDLLCQKLESGKKVLGDNCCTFLVRNSSPNLSSTKIGDKIDTLRSEVDTKSLDEIKSVIEDKHELWYLVKGHFIDHAVLNLIKQEVKKERGREPKLSMESLTALLIDCSKWKDELDIQSTLAEISDAVNSLPAV